MSLAHRTRGVKVLKAVSSSLRLQILNLLFDRNALSYTELMSALKMNPSRDAGKFAYHLKFLLKANLVEANVDTKKYYLTDLGKMLIDIADRVEKNALKPKSMLVRTSHSTLEEFDANKIANSLIREAKMSPEQAQKIAKEAEKILLKSRTKFLTAPLIREIVNAILIEKGQEDYRHKLTRLGLPVHEVTNLIETRDEPQSGTTLLTKAGAAIFNEYTLLNVFPRDIADAHASGAIHVNSLSTWLLKPNEVIHDLRLFLRNGLKTTSPLQLPQGPATSLESALSLSFSVVLHAGFEVNDLQTLDHFNVFLAPYARGIDRETIKDNLRLFIQNLNQHTNAAISIDLALPSFIAEKSARRHEGETNIEYKDFAEESRLIASLIIEIVTEEGKTKQLVSPRIIIKINNETFEDESSRAILLQAHSLAVEKGVLYFANTSTIEGKYATFSGKGGRYEADLTRDWEIDTLRTGCIGIVTINLPRIVYECEKENNKFFEILKERYELATRALEIKARTLRQREKTVIPFITQNANGDKYFRLENCSHLINFAGLTEAADAFCGQNAAQGKTTQFVSEIIQNILSLRSKTGKRHGKRTFPVILQTPEASERLAQLDIEKYGVAKVRFSGTRDKPFYSSVKRLNIQETDIVPSATSESMETVQKLSPLSSGGNLTVVELGPSEHDPGSLMQLTKQLIGKQATEFFTYNRIITQCSNCNKSWFGTLNKCPSCGAISTLTVFDRFSYS